MSVAAAVDVLAGEPHFGDHLRPVYDALPADLRGVFVTTADELPPPRGRAILIAAYGDSKRARARGYTRIASMEHGIGQSYGGSLATKGDRLAAVNGSYPGGNDRDDVSLFLVPNQHAAQRWQDRYPDVRVEVIGSPRLDALPRRAPGPRTVAVSFHWNCAIVSETKSGYWYYRDAVARLARKARVIGHGHPRLFGSDAAMLGRWYIEHGIEPVRSFEDVMRRADLYVCDNSSTMYEFAASGRPVVVLNPPFYRPKVNHGLRFWTAADVGLAVRRPELLIRTVTAALEDPADVRAARERAVDTVYGYRTGAAERAAGLVAEWASGIIAPPE